MSVRRQLRLTRRRFFGLAGGVLAGGLGLGSYTWRIEPHWVEVVELDLPVPHLPPALVGKILVQISDLHVGPVVDTDHLIASMQTVSALRPDLVAITGDFMTSRRGEQIDNVARVLEHLELPPLGCLAILGNHDYGPAWSDPTLADRLTDRLTGLGIHVLRNACRSVAGLEVVGLDDLWGPCFRPDDILPTLDPLLPTVVLCHNPDAVDLPIWSGYQGWVLSGHTHGGQCKPPFLPPPLLPVKNGRYTAGVFDLEGGRTLYINRGLGYLRRVRFNVRPEITVFRLRRASQAAAET